MSQSSNVTTPREIQSQRSQSLDFAEVFREYQRPIYNYLLRMTQNQAEAEDLTQETFVRVHRSLPTFRGEASLSTWLYRIATNVSFDHFRRRTTRQAETALSLEKIEFYEDRDSNTPLHRSNWLPAPRCLPVCKHSSSTCRRTIAWCWC